MEFVFLKADVTESTCLSKIFSSGIQGLFSAFRSTVKRVSERNGGLVQQDATGNDTVVVKFPGGPNGIAAALVTALHSLNEVRDVPIQAEGLSRLEGWLASRYFILPVKVDNTAIWPTDYDQSYAILTKFEKDERLRDTAVAVSVGECQLDNYLLSLLTAFNTISDSHDEIRTMPFKFAHGVDLSTYKDMIEAAKLPETDPFAKLLCEANPAKGYWDHEMLNKPRINDVLRTVPPGSRVRVAGRTAVNWLRHIQANADNLSSRAIQLQVITFFGPQSYVPVAHSDEIIAIERDTQECIDLIKGIRRKLDLGKKAPWRPSFSFLATGNYLLDTFVQYRTFDWKEVTVIGLNLGQNEGKFHIFFENPLVARRVGSRISRLAADSVPHKPRSIVPRLARLYGGDVLRQNSGPEYLPRAIRLLRSITQQRKIPPPLCVQINLSDHCDTHCTHCGTWRSPETNLQIDVIEKIALSLKEMAADEKHAGPISHSTVVLSGGEPLLHPEFQKVVETFHTAGCPIGVLTSGRRINQDVADVLVNKVAWVRLSIDAAVNDTYREIRNPTDGKGIEVVTDALENLMSKRKAFSDDNSAKCRIGICYTIQKKNISEFREMISQARAWCEKGMIDDAYFKIAHAASMGRRDNFLMDEEELSTLLQLVGEACETDGSWCKSLGFMQNMLRRNLVSLRDVAEGRPERLLYERTAVRCYVPYLYSHISSDGTVYPCCYLYRDNSARDTVASFNKDYEMGRLIEEDFESIWQGTKYNNCRRELKVVRDFRDGTVINVCAECTRFQGHNRFINALQRIYEAFPLDNYWAEISNTSSLATFL